MGGDTVEEIILITRKGTLYSEKVLKQCPLVLWKSILAGM